MSKTKGFLFVAAVAIMIFTANASAQNMDTAYVPFNVNVDAIATARSLRGDDEFTKLVVAGFTDTLLIIVKGGSTLVRPGKTLGAGDTMHSSRGKISLELSRQLYRNADIALYSLNGKQILHGKTAASEVAKSISHPNLKIGVYLLSVKGTNGSTFTTRFTHTGGGLNIDVAFTNENSPFLLEKPISGDWIITVSAVENGYLDTTLYLFYPVLETGRGNTPVQNITLRRALPLRCTGVPTSGSAGHPITPPTLTCGNGETADIISWLGFPLIDWNNPKEGIYSDIGVKANCGTETDLIASCLSTLNVGCSGNSNTSTHYCSETMMKEYGFLTDNRDNQTYKTIVIGSQTLMAENLNYNAIGSRCYGDNTGGDSQGNCVKYGRLYDWATAMNLASNCNSSSCSGQIQSKHRGICPVGWHIPSQAELYLIVDYYIGGYMIAGEKLKATSGWNSNGNGNDQYGFSALPGGIGNSDGLFYGTGNLGIWRSASESYYESGNFAHFLILNDESKSVFISEDGDGLFDDDNIGIFDKSSLFSVRCLQDSFSYSSSSQEASSSSGETEQSYLTDSRDNQTYKIVVIGLQVWMAENLNYNVIGSRCYGDNTGGDSQGNCVKYGRLYDWATAMNLASNCNLSSCSDQIQLEHRGICPTEWHIPSQADWNVMMDYIGGEDTGGKKLKAKSGWNSCGPLGSGDFYLCEDTYGFSALPGGIGNSDGNFSRVDNFGIYWSSRENSYGECAYGRSMYYDDEFVGWYNSYKSDLFSVRCVKD